MAEGKVVLVVDDDEDIRFLVKKWLEKNGYKAITAEDGKECIKKLDEKIGLVLLDIMMPGPAPNEILEEVREKSPEARVIYLTGVEAFNLTSEQERKGWQPELEPPVIGYIEKPITEDLLMKKIKESLKMKKFLKK